MIDFDKLKAFQFEPKFQDYSARDAMLYALGLNIGFNPLDPFDLRYVADDPPKAVPAMAMILARLGPWMRDPSVGIDYRRIVVGEVSLRLHGEIPAQGKVRGDHRIVRITDKGAGRGALVTVLKELFDNDSGALLAEFEQVTFCRADGGFASDGRHDPALPTPAWHADANPPDLVLDVPTSPQQALIYRLSGDMNPLHADPEVALKAGFERPILHGLATMGMAGYALLKAIRVPNGRQLRNLRGRLSAPVFPGERLYLQTWGKEGEVLFRLMNGAGHAVVSQGFAEFQ